MGNQTNVGSEEAQLAARPWVDLALSQPRLLLGGEPSFDSTFSGVERVELDEHSWIDVVPGWVENEEALLDQLLRTATWERRKRRVYDQVFDEPRLTAQYPVIAETPIPILRAIGSALSERYGVAYDGLWMNFYRDHNDGTGWHADRPANKPETSIVPVLSLGARRRFQIKPVDGGASVKFEPAGGDLIVMGGRAQRDWLHHVPKQKTPAGARLSLNFTSRQQWDHA